MSDQTRYWSTNPWAGGKSAQSDLSDSFGYIGAPSPERVAAAQRLVAGHLTDPCAVAEVLDILGIRVRVL